jgi:acyl-CoA thioester hydrolase
MFDAESGECIATAEAVAISMDLAERKAIEIPPHMRADLERLVIPGLSV